ncbi:MAG: FtsX-like permease family protein [Actinomycetota bacterium]|nr:FtsX-like permease family protein [Actinomycetota bacterium]
MVRLVLKATLAKKFRLLSTAVSVMLGIAFLAGSLVFTDTIWRTFDDLFADIYDDVDTVVRSDTEVETGMGFSARGRFDEDVVDVVAGVDGVATAQGYVEGYAQLVDASGEAIGDPGQGAPTFGGSFLDGPVSPWELTDGSRAPGPGEIVIDRGSADNGDLAIGDTVTVLTATGPHTQELVGIVTFGSIDSPGGASASLWDLATAQEVLLGAPGEIDVVMVDAEPGVSEDELTGRIAAVVPEGLEAVTGSAMTDETQDAMHEAFGFFNTFLLVFAAIGLVVACFTIYNTFQIVVTQRMHEMALLRAVGATRNQVLVAQLAEAIVIGIVASAVGLVAGFAVAALLEAMLSSFGVDIPSTGMVFLPRTAVVAMAVGLAVTTVSAVLPSVRASRTPPLAAFRQSALDHRAGGGRRLVEGSVLTVAGAAALVAGLAGWGIQAVGAGALAIFVGVFVLGPLLARPVVRLLGAPLPAVSGAVGTLARQNAYRNPKRTARTGGALMVGVALVIAITIIAASAKDWTRDIWSEQFSGDYVVSSSSMGFGGLSTALADDLARLPEVETASGVRVGVAHLSGPAGADISYIAVDPSTASRVFDIGMIEGDLADLDVGGILLDDDEADARGLGVGEWLTLRFLTGSTETLRIEGIYTKEQLATSFVVSHDLHERSGADQFDFAVYLAAAPSHGDDEVRSAITSVSDAYPSGEVQSREEYVDAQAAQIDQLLNLMYGLLGLAVLIALGSIANSMALSIHERTRELGLLRAVGMTRRQTRASVRWEALLVALLGTGLGAVIGVFFGWSISVALRDEGLDAWSVPPTPLVVIVLLALGGGVLASRGPARKAAKLDVLRAIATE